MPELPEVETVIRGLRRIVLNETIARVRTFAPPSSIVVSPSFGRRAFGTLLKGRTIERIDRRGKNILVYLSGDIVLWVHLKMTGRFMHIKRTEPRDRHDLVMFDFESTLPDSNNLHLRFNDYRRFGRLRLFDVNELWEQPGMRELGPEPFELTKSEFLHLCRRRPRMLKPALLDQSFIAGLGNIYADEALYASRLHPRRMTTSVSPRKLTELHGHILRLLNKAIDSMGTTVNSYSGVNGETGRFQSYLLAYGREGEACGRCGGRIVREKIGSRSAHYCRTCQRPPRQG